MEFLVQHAADLLFYLFALGALFVGVTVFLPQGLLGLFRSWTGRSGR